MFINALTNQGYSTKNNQFLLEGQLLLGTDDCEVAGFKQWLELGRCVAKGQKGTAVYMVVPKKVPKKDGTEEKKSVIKRGPCSSVHKPSNWDSSYLVARSQSGLPSTD